MSLQSEMQTGYEAGWRGDELIGEKSTVYMMWYEIGQAERAAAKCQTSTNSSSAEEETFR